MILKTKYKIEMKKGCSVILLCALLAWFVTGCERTPDRVSPLPEGEIAFVSAQTRGGDDGGPYSERDLKGVPDTVGAFIIKTLGGTPNTILKNERYQLSKYKSNNYLSRDIDGKSVVDYRPESSPGSDEEQLFWYKTTNPLAYWDHEADYRIFAYAPYAAPGSNSPYYTVADNGDVNFKINEQLGIPVDFIYADSGPVTKVADSESLHMTFNHKLSKIVFRLSNSTGNAVTCYGVKYKIAYPEATFNLLSGNWNFTSSLQQVEVKRYAQYEIFQNTPIPLPELTTLLFPTHSANRESSSAIPGNVVVNFEVCLNNIWYDLTNALKGLNGDTGLEYEEGKLIELTFNCGLTYGDEDDGVLWNIFVATFDSFEYGGSINDVLK